MTIKVINLFGIKGCGPAGSITVQTTEYVNGKDIKVTAPFRANYNWGESLADHSELIAGLLDTPSGGSYDFCRIITVLNRADLLVPGSGK